MSVANILSTLLTIVLLLIAAIAVVIAVYFYRHPEERKRLLARLAGYKAADETAPVADLRQSATVTTATGALPTDTMAGKTKSQLLPNLRAGQAVTLAGDRERQVVSAVRLVEMEQRGGDKSPWVPKGGLSTGIIMSGDIILLRVPESEGGDKIWLKLSPLKASGLRLFYQGGETESTYGPARRFRRVYKQRTPVPYKLPGSLTPGVTWQVVDIGAFKAELSGETDRLNDGGLYMFVTSREKDGDRWLIFLDPRELSGFRTTGSGGLYMGEPFDPETEVTEIL